MGDPPYADARVKDIAWGTYEPYEFKGAKGDTVHGFVVKPANVQDLAAVIRRAVRERRARASG